MLQIPGKERMGWLSAMAGAALLLMPLSTSAAVEGLSDTTPATEEAVDSAASQTSDARDLARGCGRCPRGAMRGAGHHRGRRSGPPTEMQLAHFLIDNHDRLTREVEMIDGGVRTRTTAADEELVRALRTHVREMATMLEDGGRIRNWDPLFREIFEHRDLIEIRISDIDGGVEVIETSTDRSVAQLVQAHARKVDEFVARGRAACHEETPLPSGFERTGS